MSDRALRRRGRPGAHVPVLALAALACLGWLGGASAAFPQIGAPGGDADGVRAEAHLDPRVVRPDGTVRFEIEVEGQGLSQPRLRPRFELRNLELIGGPDQSHGIKVGTGGAAWRYSWTWYLRPRSVGEAAVTEIRVLVGDRVVELSSRRIRVAPGGSPGANGADGRGDGRDRRPPAGAGSSRRTPSDGTGPTEEPRPVFLHAEVEPPHPYVGQRTLYTTYLYTRVRVRAYDPTAMPSFDGCWARSVDLSAVREEPVYLDGTPYQRVPIFQRVLYPLRPGTLDLGAMRLRLLIERIERSRLFFGPVRVPDQVVEESNRIELPVRPLPAPAAELAGRFGGAVGPLEVTAELDRTEVAVDHGATLTVVVRGEGHLGALRPPAIDAPEGIDVIGPQSAPALELEPTGTGDAAGASPVTSRRAWSYVLVPRKIDSFSLPPVEIAYFDPAAVRYRVASSTLPDLVARAPGERLAGRDADDGLHSIRSAALPGPAPRRWASLLPWAFGIPWVLALALLAARRSGGPLRLPRALRLRRLLGPPDGHRRAFERLRDGVERAAAEDRPRRAAIGLERAWRAFLGDTFGIPETVPVSGWCDALADRGLPAAGRHRLAALLEDLHYLRYAPELSDIRSVALDLADRSTDLADELLDAAGPVPAGAATGDPTSGDGT